MVIGTFGDVVYEVSAERVRTFNEFSRSSADRWNTHELIGLKPKSEFAGPGLDKINFTMSLDVSLGINPRVEMEKLLVMSREGRAEDLTIGGKGLGVGKWIIKSLRQNWSRIDNQGNLLQATLDVELEEYV